MAAKITPSKPATNPGVTVRVNTIPSQRGQTWTLTGPEGFTSSNMGDAVFKSMPDGNYSILWAAVAGYDPPSPAAVGPIALTSGNIHVFETPAYIPNAMNGNIHVDPTGAPTGATWSISPGGFTGDTTEVTFPAAPDSYTITWNNTAPGWVPPDIAGDPTVLTSGATIDFVLADDPYVINQGEIVVDMTGAPSGAAWSIEPGGYSGTTGTTISDADANEVYVITWADSVLSHTPPTAPGQVLSVGGSITFDLTSNYVARTTAGIQVDVDIQGSPTTGAWTFTPPAPFGAPDFVSSGTQNATDVTPSVGDFYEGRQYTITYSSEVGFTAPPSEQWVAAVGTKTFTGVFTAAGTANRDYDANGWVILNLPGGDKAVYVSQSTGSDGNSGLSVGAPKATIAAGEALITNGSGDHLLLLRGDTWTNEQIDFDTKSGRSRTEPLVCGSYSNGNPTDPRPKLNFTGGGDSIANGGTGTFKAYLDLDIEHTGGPFGQLPDFGNSGKKSYLFEGCSFKHVTGGFQGPATNGFDVEDLEVHRCTFTDFGDDWYNKWFLNWKLTESMIDQGGPGHATYWVNQRGLTMDGCILSRPNPTVNGTWMKFSSNGDGGSGGSDADPMSMGPTGQGYTTDITITNNCFMGGYAGTLSIGGNNDVTTPRWNNITVEDNVQIGLGFRWESPGSPTGSNSGEFIKIEDWNTGTINNNIDVWGLRDEGNPEDHCDRHRFFIMRDVRQPQSPGPGQYMPVGGVHISGNVVTDYFQDSSSTGVIDFRNDAQNITFHDNVIQNTRNGAAPLIQIVPAGTNDFDNNTYYSVEAASQWFGTGGTLAGWASAVGGEAGSTALGSPQTFVEERTVEQYHEDVCNAASGSFNSFLDDALTHHHKQGWDKDAVGGTTTPGIWSGTAFSAWMKAGWTPT